MDESTQEPWRLDAARLIERARRARLEAEAIRLEARRLIEDAHRAMREAGKLATRPRDAGE